MRALRLIRAGMDGADWYRTARPLVAAMAYAAGASERDTAYALSAFSPRVSVRRSVSLAWSALTLGPAPAGSLPCATIAWRHYLATGDLRGPKTRAFARNLLGNEESITVDVWVLRGLGHPVPTGPRMYHQSAGVVRMLADLLEMAPARCQAALWAGTMRAYNRRPVSLACIIEETLRGE